MGQALLRLAAERDDLSWWRPCRARSRRSAWSMASRISPSSRTVGRARHSMSPSTSACRKVSTRSCALCVERGAALVSGTTGLEAEQRDALDGRRRAASRCCGRRTSASAWRCCTSWSSAPPRRCRAGTATSSNRTTCTRRTRRPARRWRWVPARSRAGRIRAMPVAARRRHRRRAHRAVRHAGRAHRADPSRHQPRHLRPRRAPCRSQVGRTRTGRLPFA